MKLDKNKEGKYIVYAVKQFQMYEKGQQLYYSECKLLKIFFEKQKAEDYANSLPKDMFFGDYTESPQNYYVEEIEVE